MSLIKQVSNIRRTLKRPSPCLPRWTYPDFFNRYRVLMKKSDMTISDKKLVCKKLLETLVKVGGPLVPLLVITAPPVEEGGRMQKNCGMKPSGVFIQFLCVSVLLC